MGKNISRKMRIATWSLQNPPIQKVYYIPKRRVYGVGCRVIN